MYSEELRRDGVIPMESHQGIFSNLEDIRKFQGCFLKQIENILTTDVQFDVGASYKAGIGKLFADNEGI